MLPRIVVSTVRRVRSNTRLRKRSGNSGPIFERKPKTRGRSMDIADTELWRDKRVMANVVASTSTTKVLNLNKS